MNAVPTSAELVESVRVHRESLQIYADRETYYASDVARHNADATALTEALGHVVAEDRGGAQERHAIRTRLIQSQVMGELASYDLADLQALTEQTKADLQDAVSALERLDPE